MQPRTRKTISVIGVAATFAAVAFDVHLSLDPDQYFYYGHQERADWQYNPANVAFVATFMLAAGSLAFGALAVPRPRALWLRCMIALAVLVPWGLFSSMFVLHMPSYVLFHILWVWSLIALLILIGVSSLIRQAYTRLRGSPPNKSFKPTPSARLN